MDHLLIDLGNTRLKWALDHEGRLEYGDALSHREPGWTDRLQNELANVKTPASVMVCSVADQATTTKLKSMIDALWQMPVTLITSPKLGNGVSSAYSDAAALGSDRWAAMIAAYNKAKTAVCVVDCGTAVTLDIIDHKGRHQGGLIIPGLGLMENALSVHTQVVPKTAPPSLSAGDKELGSDTPGCIQAGSVHAVCGLIERSVQQMNRRLKTSLECYITGGDARQVIPHLNLRAHFEPYLVLQGLALMARAA